MEKNTENNDYPPLERCKYCKQLFKLFAFSKAKICPLCKMKGNKVRSNIKKKYWGDIKNERINNK